jgi:multicomponent Na+:H+ antiporter subunit D
MIQENLLALQVVIPLVAAPLCLLLRNGFLAWLLALAASWIALAVSVVLLIQVLDLGVISYEMGDC